MFNLGEYLPYLLNRAGARIATNFTRDVRHLDISLQEWRVMAALQHSGAQRMSDLADLTSVDRTTLSRLIGRMEDAGLVRRERIKDDGREVHIHLSDKGQTITAEILPLAARYEDVALDGFSEAEVEALKSMLKRIYGNLDRL